MTKHLHALGPAVAMITAPAHNGDNDDDKDDNPRRAAAPRRSAVEYGRTPAVLNTPGVVRLAEQSSRPELNSFRINLARAMEAKGLSASQLAKAIWGEMKDSRGISVARNRDRLTHYLAGASYPSPPTLTKMAEVLDLDPDMLARDNFLSKGTATATEGDNPGPKSHALGISMTLVAPVGGEPLAMLSLHKPLPLPIAMLVLNLCAGSLSMAEMLKQVEQTYRPSRK